jgi:hypothetical protein
VDLKNIFIIVIGKIQHKPYFNLYHPGNKMLLAHTLSRLADQRRQKPTGREAILLPPINLEAKRTFFAKHNFFIN